VDLTCLLGSLLQLEVALRQEFLLAQRVFNVGAHVLGVQPNKVFFALQLVEH